MIYLVSRMVEGMANAFVTVATLAIDVVLWTIRKVVGQWPSR